MNYYPNQNYLQPNPTFMQPNPIYTTQYPVINGKIVDSVETAKNQDIPFGSYAVFPKADMNSVFIKTWNKDGTTQLVEYERVTPKEPIVVEDKQDYSEILNAISSLNGKIDEIISRNNYVKKQGGVKNE